MERDKRRKSKIPCLFGGNGDISTTRKTVQNRSASDVFTEKNLLAFEVGQASAKQVYGTSMKTLLAKEMSNETAAKKRSPSLIAKLMGLDGLPSPQPVHKQQRKVSDNSQKSSVKKNEKLGSYQLDKKTSMEQQHFKDVYEDPEASHVANRLYSSPLSAKRRSTKQELGYIQERCDEMLRESIAIKNKLERVDSNSDLMLSYLHKDQQEISFGSPCNQITLLKPASYVRHTHHGKRLKEANEMLNYHVPVTYQRNEDVLLDYSYHHTTNPRRSSRYQVERKDTSVISPTRIVVLKPNLVKIYDDQDLVHSSDEYRGNRESSEVRSSRYKSREAREIARHITSQMKEGFEGGHVNLFDSGYRGYGSAFASESEVMAISSRSSFDRPRRSPSESAVIREAKKRMSRRWKTHGYQDVGMVGKGSTLKEMLSVPNNEMRHDKTGSVVSPVGVGDEYDWREEYLRSTSRSRPVPPSSCYQSHTTNNYQEAHVEEKIMVHNEQSNRTKSKGIKGNCKRREDSRSKSSRNGKSSQSSLHCNACNPKFDNSVPENHYSRKPTTTCFENEDAAEEESLIRDIHEATTNEASFVDVVRVPSESTTNELIEDADSSAADEDTSNSQGTVSIQLSGPEPDPESSEGSKEIEVDQHGQISVSEVPLAEDVSSGSDCFERVSSQLLELRKQLHLLKMESGSTYDSPNDEEIEQGSSFSASESDNWESSYLTDVLQSSSFYDHEPLTFMTTWYLVDYPRDTWLFDHLEKKYSQDPTVSKPERRLFHDRIHEALCDITKTMISCSWVNPGKRGIQITLTETGFEDQLQKVLTKQEKDASMDFEEMSIDKDHEWLEPVDEIDVVGRQIADVLLKELVLEIVCI
uniref:uncharacterized protein LOC122605532 n=1 Tax=Erigeron canadensis TaxID=72917 RepID=UPI001CB8B9B4|nr:uncharacterized protein LOC122605532 [Erigeron canadensis]